MVGVAAALNAVLVRACVRACVCVRVRACGAMVRVRGASVSHTPAHGNGQVRCSVWRWRLIVVDVGVHIVFGVWM